MKCLLKRFNYSSITAYAENLAEGAPFLSFVDICLHTLNRSNGVVNTWDWRCWLHKRTCVGGE
jgi:hypothetical protein